MQKPLEQMVVGCNASTSLLCNWPGTLTSYLFTTCRVNFCPHSNHLPLFFNSTTCPSVHALLALLCPAREVPVHCRSLQASTPFCPCAGGTNTAGIRTSNAKRKKQAKGVDPKFHCAASCNHKSHSQGRIQQTVGETHGGSHSTKCQSKEEH